MKTPQFVVVALVFFSSLAGAQVRRVAAEIDLNEPPFYMMNYSEVSDIQEDQRSLYFKEAVASTRKLKALDSPKAVEALTAKELAGALNSESAWKQVMVRVYRACQDGRNERTCEALLEARIKAFELKGRQSLEDRQPPKPHSTSQPTTRPPSK